MPLPGFIFSVALLPIYMDHQYFCLLKADGKPHLDQSRRIQFAILHQERFSERPISNKVGCSKIIFHNASTNFECFHAYSDEP